MVELLQNTVVRFRRNNVFIPSNILPQINKKFRFYIIYKMISCCVLVRLETFCLDQLIRPMLVYIWKCSGALSAGCWSWAQLSGGGEARVTSSMGSIGWQFYSCSVSRQLFRKMVIWSVQVFEQSQLSDRCISEGHPFPSNANFITVRNDFVLECLE